MGKETPQVNNEEQLTDSNRQEVRLFPKSVTVFSRRILPKIFEIASFTIFTAIASGKKRHRQVLTKYTAHKPLLDIKTQERLERASIKHDFLFEAALHTHPGKDRNRNELIFWLRQHGLMQREIQDILGISAGRISQIEKSKGKSRGVVRTSTDRMLKEMDEIGQERIDEMIKRIAEDPEFRDKKYTSLKTRKVLKELGLPYRNSNLNALRIRYLEKKYHFPKSKAELLFRAKYPHLKDYKHWLTQLYVEQSIPAEKIAALLGVSPYTIGSELVRLGLKTKSKMVKDKIRKIKAKKPTRTLPVVSMAKSVEPSVKLEKSSKQMEKVSDEEQLSKFPKGRLMKAIGRLREEEKEVLTYFLFKDYSIEDIAYVLGKEKKFVERLLHRAQSHLKKILEGK